jgi:phage terminase small subunit
MPLSSKQDKYVSRVLQGKSKSASVKEAGYGKAVTSVTVERSEEVRTALASARSELAESTQITRPQVLEMFQEAYEMAKLSSEPASMISAAKEIGKMLGFYEPETIKVQLTQSQASLQHRYRTMSRQELLEIANGQARLIDGDFTRVS